MSPPPITGAQPSPTSHPERGDIPAASGCPPHLRGPPPRPPQHPIYRCSICPDSSTVLQPAVEAFFLVHATERESKPPVRDTRESQLAHIKDEPPPLSPAPLTPATPSSLDPFFSREPSSMHISASLPPDTQKFLRFAGERSGKGGFGADFVGFCREPGAQEGVLGGVCRGFGGVCRGFGGLCREPEAVGGDLGETWGLGRGFGGL